MYILTTVDKEEIATSLNVTHCKMEPRKVVFDFRDVADKIKFLPIVPKYGGPVATFVYTSPTERIVVTLFHSSCIKITSRLGQPAVKEERDLKGYVLYVDDNCIVSEGDYYCWRGEFKSMQSINEVIGYVTVADRYRYQGIGYYLDQPVILFRYDFGQRNVGDIHPAFKPKPTMKDRAAIEEGALGMWHKYPKFLDQARNFNNLPFDKIYVRTTRVIEYPIYPNVGSLATDNPVLRRRVWPDEVYPSVGDVATDHPVLKYHPQLEEEYPMPEEEPIGPSRLLPAKKKPVREKPVKVVPIEEVYPVPEEETVDVIDSPLKAIADPVQPYRKKLSPTRMSPCTKGVTQESYTRCLGDVLELVDPRTVSYCHKGSQMRKSMANVYQIRNFDEVRMTVLPWRFYDQSPLFIVGSTSAGELVISKLYVNNNEYVQSFYHVTFHQDRTHLSYGVSGAPKYVIDCTHSPPVLTVDGSQIQPGSLKYYLKDTVDDVVDLLELVGLVNSSSCLRSQSPQYSVQTTAQSMPQPAPRPRKNEKYRRPE